MSLKSDVTNAVKLFILLVLLLWSFTWNTDENFDLPVTNEPKRGDLEVPNDDYAMVINQHSDLVATFSAVRYGFKKSSKPSTVYNAFIPTFNEWKEIEKIKYEKLSPKDEGNVNHHKNVGKRKLNYASSKCGAKILASNPETKYRFAILNEKPDEYMLNPCRVQTWFIIELCDTVEATQIELANYELYSSSPKAFSIFWSDIYPTHVWHFFGTFEAKDQRTIQTFHLKSKNLGKFIKVTINTHHGKEHYCPLSVIRVLGYSMVEKFEDLEDSNGELNLFKKELDRNSSLIEQSLQRKNNTAEFKDISIDDPNVFLIKSCAFYLKLCNLTILNDKNMICLNEPLCRLLMVLLLNAEEDCFNIFCPRNSRIETESFNKKRYKVQQDKNNFTDTSYRLTTEIGQENSAKKMASKSKIISKDQVVVNSQKENSSNVIAMYDGALNKIVNRVNASSKLSINFTQNFGKLERNGTFQSIVYSASSNSNKCLCESSNKYERTGKENGEFNFGDLGEQSLAISEKEVDSAGLFHKESVLFKLTTRIKAAEMDLNLINSYLQQLSQSYRQQMEDMKVMVNQTVRAVNVASEKAITVDKKQQDMINDVQQKVVSLSRRVEYLKNGQRDMIKRVIEMHAFFLILEFIILSTVFTIILNIFHQKTASLSS